MSVEQERMSCRLWRDDDEIVSRQKTGCAYARLCRSAHRSLCAGSEPPRRIRCHARRPLGLALSPPSRLTVTLFGFRAWKKTENTHLYWCCGNGIIFARSPERVCVLIFDNWELDIKENCNVYRERESSERISC